MEYSLTKQDLHFPSQIKGGVIPSFIIHVQDWPLILFH